MLGADKNYSNNPPTGSGSTGSPGDSHKNEGFLKSAWHRLMNQHKPADTAKGPEASKKDSSESDHEEPKKASESG